LPSYHTLKIKSITPSSVGANSFVLILESIISTNLSFPIVIGNHEAQSISIVLEGISVKRPLTHDLFINIFSLIDVSLEFVEITRFNDGIFYAELNLLRENKQFVVDARPSDALSIAIRLNKEIRIPTNLFNSICINTNEIIDSEPIVEVSVDISKSDLEMELKKALADENYEEAAKLRDKIEQMNVRK
jgi:bifunctional DNase/RNase